MGVPRLTLANISLPANPNLTTLTGGVTSQSSIRGYSGAAWHFQRSQQQAHKLEAAEQLFPTLYGTPALAFAANAFSPSNIVTFDPLDCQVGQSGNSGSGDAGGVNIGAGNVACGVSFTPYAGRDLKVFTYIGNSFGGQWRVYATLSDGSATTGALDLPQNGVGCFTCTFSSTDPNATVLIKVQRDTSTGGGFMAYQCCWIGVPTKAAVPRHYSNYLRYQGMYGGRNA